MVHVGNDVARKLRRLYRQAEGTNDGYAFRAGGVEPEHALSRPLTGRPPVDCRRVLDVGCGLGTFARRLARVVAHVDALDRDRDALARAKQLSRDLPNVRFVEADFLTWQPEGAYDAVSMVA